MSIAYATDEDIEQMILTCPAALEMRSRLYAARFEARYELERQKAAEAETYAQCARIEDETTDAGKADSGPRGFTLYIDAAPMQGKTTALLAILGALGDAGLLDAFSTKALTENPMQFLSQRRILNESNREGIVIDLDLKAVITSLIA